MKFDIFGRWGELIHTGVPEWDGTMEGKELPTGAYVYVIAVEDLNGELITYKGDINLVR